jgi:NADPH:quinone reductase-like Zn-dependent oxidoreductase
MNPNTVPGSDGAGEVVAIGSKVTRFKVGDKVVTLFNQTHLGGSLDQETVKSGLGGAIHGTLRQYGTFNENGLVEMPSSLNWLEASTLSCAALTAWNALYGLKPLLPGDTVLTQGTGGVSIFAVQFAKAAGATVSMFSSLSSPRYPSNPTSIVATTSSAAKVEVLKKLGADHVINYKDEPNWGEVAKALTPKGEGCAHIIEVAGPVTMAQSLKAIKIDGLISIIGFVGGNATDAQPGFLDTLMNICIVRGILVGSRTQFEDMVSFCIISFCFSGVFPAMRSFISFTSGE